MSCEIIYDKAFIKVESGIIPMICSGSSNCMEFTIQGRQVRERNWFVLKPSSERRNIFTVTEVRELAENYDKIISESGGSICKGYYKPFAEGEFKRWFLEGLKSAATVEEYVHAGNSLLFVAQGYTIRISVTNEQQLKSLLTEYEKDATAMLMFMGRFVIKPNQCRRKRTQTDYSELDCYYVLKSKRYYVWNLTPRWIKYTISLGAAKKFVSEKKAEQYVNKHAARFKKEEISIVRIENGGAK